MNGLNPINAGFSGPSNLGWLTLTVAIDPDVGKTGRRIMIAQLFKMELQLLSEDLDSGFGSRHRV